MEQFRIERDSTNLRKYDITPLCKIQQGWDYIFRIPERTFKDINGHWNDSTNVKITLPNDEDLSSLTLNIKGVDNKYIVDFQNESKSEIKRT